MRIAVPNLDGRVSPVFDVARSLVLVDVDHARETARSQEVLEATDIFRRAERVKQLGVDVVICGAVSRPLEAVLEAAGIQVFCQTCGAVEDVLAAFLGGRLSESSFLMPGCCGRRGALGAMRRRRRRRSGGRGG